MSFFITSFLVSVYLQISVVLSNPFLQFATKTYARWVEMRGVWVYKDTGKCEFYEWNMMMCNCCIRINLIKKNSGFSMTFKCAHSIRALVTMSVYYVICQLKDFMKDNIRSMWTGPSVLRLPLSPACVRDLALSLPDQAYCTSEEYEIQWQGYWIRKMSFET